MRIKWLRKAILNLQSEAEYIAQDSPGSARRVVARIVQQIAHLTDYPKSGRVRRIAGTRELVVIGTPYIVPYRIKNDSIEILRVFHSARKWPKSL